MIPVSLNDAVSLLLQLEVTDTGGLVVLRDGLHNIMADSSLPGPVSTHVRHAVRLLNTIIDGTSPDASADFTHATEALDAALNDPTPAVGERHTFDADDALLRDFVHESAEYVALAETALLALEANTEDVEAINTIFRAFHTVKGTSALLGLTHIAEFAHVAESLLMRVRDGEVDFSAPCADLALRAIDMMKLLLSAAAEAMARNGPPVQPAGYHALVLALNDYQSTADTTNPALNADAHTRDASSSSAQASPSLPGMSFAAESDVAGPLARTDSMVDASIRVRTDRLDRLIDMVGELVIAQTMIAGDEHMANAQHPELARKVAHASKIVRELQELSMSMRMVPLRSTFQKLARVVRDTASKVGKTVQFTTEGEDVEIDRNLVDILADPLVHMVRNAVDHGIESPDERDRAGKSRTGSVRLHAYHSSGNVVVDLTDDGGGLHRDRIVAKALQTGLIESDRGMSDSDVFNLIFEPGFSTAAQVTDISGRGVGLDVVRRNLELIRGRLEISSEAGGGTTFSLRLPLTLAVTDGMLVRVGDERFVIPLTQIHMSFRPEAHMLSTVVGHGEMVSLRGSLMPIVRLHRMFGVARAIENPLAALLVIVGDGSQRSALMVDELLGQQQVVAKPLGDALGRIPGFSGAAILGDGRVGLILDVRETMSLTAPSLKLAS